MSADAIELGGHRPPLQLARMRWSGQMFWLLDSEKG